MKGIVLKPAASDQLRRVHSKLYGVQEFLEGALEAIGDDRLESIVNALQSTAPWAGTLLDATAESLPPVKFLLELFKGVTEVNDPNQLGELACTLAFQRAVEQSVPALLSLEPPRKALVKRVLTKRMCESYDFTTLTWEAALQHPFVKDATAALEELGHVLGFEGPWNVRLQREAQARFVTNLKGILSHGKTRERFAPFAERLELGSNEVVLRRAILDHAETQRWQFEERPVLGAEPFSLAEVYIKPVCTMLEWEVLGKQHQDPFDPKLERYSLHDGVVRAFGDASYRELLFVQGPAGSGKSSFTLELATHLIHVGMTPLRVELKHLDSRADLPLFDALARALECNDLGRFPDLPRFLPQTNEYESEFRRLFDQEIAFQGLSICPYVLILDGLDELPLSGNHNYLERVRKLLSDLKETFLRRREPAFPVRVLLSGRPSPFLEQAGVIGPKTRILTVQPWSTQELQRFIAAIEGAQQRAQSLPTRAAQPATWRLPPQATLESLVERFSSADDGALAVLSSPLIAHLCLRLLGEYALTPANVGAEGTQVTELLSDATTLYRNLVDLVIAKAGKPPEADYRPADGAMIAGTDLRWLLQKTAEVMTVLGVENVAHEELLLSLDLQEAELDEWLKQLEGKEVISRLMISFFFKGGHQALGCEFSHKSFREYLFAEAVVEALKGYARATKVAPPERPSDDYWKDFDEQDPRWAFSRRLSELLGPQWLTAEVARHLLGLIDWELARSRRPDGEGRESSTLTCSLADWSHIRDGLADLWDWWGEGGHLRPQPCRRPKSKEYDWSPPFAFELAREARFHAEKEIRPPPIRITTVDAHLGDALCLLNVVVHRALLTQGTAQSATAARTLQDLPARRYQWSSRGLRFAPGGADGEFFRQYLHRINAAGYRPGGEFPDGADLGSVDLSEADLSSMDLSDANLSDANLSGVDLSDANLGGANLSDANLSDTNLNRANLSGANLSDANLSDANLSWANLRRTNLRRANLSDAALGSARLSFANLSQANLSGANLSGANLSDADLRGADLSRANLSDAKLRDADLSDAKLSGADFHGADLRRCNIDIRTRSSGQGAQISHPPPLDSSDSSLTEGQVAGRQSNE